MFKTAVSLLLITSFSTFATQTLTGLNGISFGQSSDSVIEKVSNKPGFEKDYGGNNDDLRFVKWDVIISGVTYTTRSFFNDTSKVRAFNMTRMIEDASRSVCDSQHMEIAETINGKYNVKRIGFANLQFGVGYRTSLWKFDETHHIELNTNHNKILNRCHIMVWYRNESIDSYTLEVYAQWLKSRNEVSDGF